MIEEEPTPAESANSGEPFESDETVEALAEEMREEAEGKREPNLFFAWLRETGLVLVLALGLSVLLRTFIFQAFYVPSVSMMDTLLRDDRIIASKLSYRFGDIQRGDIIVFRDPNQWLGMPIEQEGWRGRLTDALTWIGLLPANSGEDLVKRVIGLPGDSVKCCTPDEKILVNGYALDESEYAVGSSSGVKFDIVVPEGRIFVMGDNREESADSRYHLDEFNGTVPIDNVVGQVSVLLWPLERFDIPGNPLAGQPIPSPKG